MQNAMISELVNVVKQQNAKHRKTRVIEIRKNLNQAPEQPKNRVRRANIFLFQTSSFSSSPS